MPLNTISRSVRREKDFSAECAIRVYLCSSVAHYFYLRSSAFICGKGFSNAT
jgi:hypothetical protein